MTWEEIKATIKNGHLSLLDLFDERQRKEIAFSIIYAEKYAHGTDGHNAKMIISKMAEIMELVQDNITFTEDGKQ